MGAAIREAGKPEKEVLNLDFVILALKGSVDLRDPAVETSRSWWLVECASEGGAQEDSGVTLGFVSGVTM